MRLVVEDEHVGRSPVLGERRRLVHFDRADLEERLAEGFIDRNEGRGQPARALEELAAADPELFRSGIGQFLDPELDVLLLFGLRMRQLLAVGDHPGWNRGLKRLGLGWRTLVELFVVQPCVLFARTGISF
jgi:hypothetical protein